MGNTTWDYVPFCDAVDILDNLRKPINSKERQSRIAGKQESELYPYYGATGQVGYIDDYLTDGEYVLLGEDGAPFLDAYAKKAYIISGKTWVNNHAHILRSKTDNKFLCYYLNSINYKDFVSGTTRYKLTQQAMKKILVPVPPLEEQQRIVARIEELFSELDAAVATLERTKEQLAVYRQAVLKEAFEKYPSEIKSLSELIEKPRYGTSKKCDYLDLPSAVPVYRIPNIDYIHGIISKDDIKSAEFTDEEKETWKLNPGDILVIRSNGSVSLVGRASLITESDTDSLFAGYLIRLRILNQEILYPKYLLHFLSTHEARTYIELKAKSTSGVNNINSNELKDLKIRVCNIEHQIAVVSEIESRLSICDKIEETVTTALQKAEAIRQSILKQAFEGDL